MIDPNSTTQHFRRAQLREPSLRQPCGKCPACVAKKPRECVRMLGAKQPELVDPEKPNLSDPSARPNPECGCRACNPTAWWMVVCKICGNKRCPHAEDHRFECSRSNAVGQTPKIGPSRAQEPNVGTFMTVAVSDSGNGGVGVFFVIPGQPMGKPRQTQSDKWKKRPCVVRYRAWADKARECAPKEMPKAPMCITLIAYFQIPKRWSSKKRKDMLGKPHRQVPDADNVLKCIDGLFKQDKGISDAMVSKRWDDGNGARMEVTVL